MGREASSFTKAGYCVWSVPGKVQILYLKCILYTQIQNTQRNSSLGTSKYSWFVTGWSALSSNSFWAIEWKQWNSFLKKNLFPVCFPICLNLSTFGEAPSQWLQVLGVIGVSYIHYSVPLSIGVDLEVWRKRREDKNLVKVKKVKDLTVRSNNSLGRVSQAPERKFFWTKITLWNTFMCQQIDWIPLFN